MKTHYLTRVRVKPEYRFSQSFINKFSEEAKKVWLDDDGKDSGIRCYMGNSKKELELAVNHEKDKIAEYL